MASNKSWNKIVNDYKILKHDFNKTPFTISAKQIKRSCQAFKKTHEKEVRILCKQDARENRPDAFIDNDLFLLPVKNGLYNIIKGEGYFDIPLIKNSVIQHKSILNFELDSSKVGDSEMQHLDFAYATSIIRTFVQDESLVLTIRGRKYTPTFNFFVNKQKINVQGVQTEVDAGYEGKDKIVLIEAKKSNTSNVIIRQLYYPFRQWQNSTKKKVIPLFFQKNNDDNTYSIWEFRFDDINDYNSIAIVKSERFKLI